MSNARFEDVNTPWYFKYPKRAWWWIWDRKWYFIVIIAIILVLVSTILEESDDSQNTTTMVEQSKDLTDSTTVVIVPNTVDTAALKQQWERERALADSLDGLTVVDSMFYHAEFNGDGKKYLVGYYLLKNGEKQYIDKPQLVAKAN